MRARKKIRRNSISLGILGHPKTGIAVLLQTTGYIPFLAKCFSPKANAGERKKIVQTLQVCAQNTNTQNAARLSDGAVQTVRKTSQTIPCTRLASSEGQSYREGVL